MYYYIKHKVFSLTQFPTKHRHTCIYNMRTYIEFNYVSKQKFLDSATANTYITTKNTHENIRKRTKMSKPESG